jgi:hypothetical protein
MLLPLVDVLQSKRLVRELIPAANRCTMALRILVCAVLLLLGKFIGFCKGAD